MAINGKSLKGAGAPSTDRDPYREDGGEDRAGSAMTREQGRRRAAVLLILTVVLWFHAWFPALVVVAFVVWALLHKRLEGDLRQGLLPLWRRVWPPAPPVLVPLLVAATVAYWVSDEPMVRRIIPLTLNLFALSMILFGSWWRLVPHYRGRDSALTMRPHAHRAGHSKDLL
jgi:hypothetical protein